MVDGPDHGYRARSRITRRSGSRSTLLGGMVGLAVVAWLGATLAFPPPDPNESLPPAIATPPVAVLTPPPLVTPIVNRLPGAPAGLLPIIGFTSDGPPALVLIDPTTGSVAAELLGPCEMALLRADGGSVCARVDPTSPDDERDGAAIEVGWFDAGGRPIAGGSVDLGAGAFVGPGEIHGGVDPRDGSLVLATVVHVGVGWTARLDRLDVSGALVAGSALVTGGGASDPSANTPHVVSVSLAPDGRHARIVLAGAEFPGSAWTVDTRLHGFGDPVPVPDPLPGWDIRDCQAEGWAGPESYARICSVIGPDQDGLDTVIETIDLDGTTREVAVHDHDGIDPAGWIIDAASGRAYGWSPWSVTLYSVDLLSGVVARRTFETLRSDDPVIEAPPPAPRAGLAMWQDGATGRAMPGPIAGSPDGSVVYLAGRDVARASAASTGIWAVDTETLRLVGHGPPGADYGTIAVLPGGRYVLATGSQTLEQSRQVGTEGVLLVIHDALDLRIVETIRRIASAIGNPRLLPPGGVP